MQMQYMVKGLRGIIIHQTHLKNNFSKYAYSQINSVHTYMFCKQPLMYKYKEKLGTLSWIRDQRTKQHALGNGGTAKRL